jgi:hypothetical protein
VEEPGSKAGKEQSAFVWEREQRQIDLRAGSDQNILPIHPDPLFRNKHLHPHSRYFSTLANSVIPHSFMFTHDLSGWSYQIPSGSWGSILSWLSVLFVFCSRALYCPATANGNRKEEGEGGEGKKMERRRTDKIPKSTSFTYKADTHTFRPVCCG